MSGETTSEFGTSASHGITKVDRWRARYCNYEASSGRGTMEPAESFRGADAMSELEYSSEPTEQSPLNVHT